MEVMDWNALLTSVGILNAIICVWSLWRRQPLAAFGTGMVVATVIAHFA